MYMSGVSKCRSFSENLLSKQLTRSLLQHKSCPKTEADTRLESDGLVCRSQGGPLLPNATNHMEIFWHHRRPPGVQGSDVSRAQNADHV